MDDQGSEHTISGLWASRFVASDVPLPLAEYFDRVTGRGKRERIHEDLLWDKPEPFTWTPIAVDEVPTTNPTPRDTLWRVQDIIRDDDF
jgi:hypothetical protein